METNEQELNELDLEVINGYYESSKDLKKFLLNKEPEILTIFQKEVNKNLDTFTLRGKEQFIARYEYTLVISSSKDSKRVTSPTIEIGCSLSRCLYLRAQTLSDGVPLPFLYRLVEALKQLDDLLNLE